VSSTLKSLCAGWVGVAFLGQEAAS
jgi:hypothetical protein